MASCESARRLNRRRWEQPPSGRRLGQAPQASAQPAAVRRRQEPSREREQAQPVSSQQALELRRQNPPRQ